VPVDERQVGPEPLAQALLVAVGPAEGGLQLLGEPAQLAASSASYSARLEEKCW
jgi:hypothetical protein